MGETILGNRYEIIRKIGDGGMAFVYEAKDRLLNRIVAVKVLRPEFVDDEEFLAKFKREAEAVANISHPNIVNVYDVGCDGKVNYIVMEYVDGQNLKEIIKNEGTLDEYTALDITKQIAKALSAAHKKGVIHRDIKPHNILISSEGRNVKVADFGIAKAATNSTMTNIGSIIGSVHYFSPEQAKGHTISPKSDIYSLGVVMYEMLTGKVPFTGETAVSIAIKHLQEPPIPPHELRPDIPAIVEAIVLKAMDKNPDNRFSSTEMIKEIEQAKRKPFAKVNVPTEDPFATRVLTSEEIEQLQNIEPKKTTVTPNYSQPVYQENKVEPQRKSKNSFNKTFIMGLIFILVLGFGVGAFLSYGDFWSSKTVEVPNVVGMSQAQAEETLKAENLRVEVAETFDESVPVGKVASQTPEAGKTVKESRLVTIYISKGGEEINMINLVGLSQSEAENQLAKLKLKIGQVTAEYSDKPSGTVLKQSISANNKVKKGANIDIVVSKGKEVKKVSVPNVVGQSVDSARATLEAQGFNVSASASSGSVTAQSVSAGSQVETGTTIELTVSSGSADRHENSTNTNVPDKNEQTNTTNTGTTNTTTPEKPAIEVPQRQRD